ncbi:hypothetical protein [Nocardioides kribbensis]|uniref:hypothetical protein n=1 Tax=Nocardioides kribbensis TaxID=305517 RepID=UPI0032DB6CF4
MPHPPVRRALGPGDACGLTEPLAPGMEALLRRAVLDVALSGPTRVRPPVLHVGVPGGPTAVFVPRTDDPDLDPALRSDVVAAMVRRADLLAAADRTRQGHAEAAPTAPVVWLVRLGDLALQDVDLAWLAAARAAYAEAELPLVMVVVSRTAWRDPRSGVGRSWRRLRVR